MASSLRFQLHSPLYSDSFLSPHHYLSSQQHDSSWWNATTSAGSAWWNQTASSLKQSTQSLWQSTKNTTQEAYAKLRDHTSSLAAAHHHHSTTYHPSSFNHHATKDNNSLRLRPTSDHHPHKHNDTSLTDYLAQLERRLETMEQERLCSKEELVRQQEELSALHRLQEQHHNEMWMAAAVALAPKKLPLGLQILHIAWVSTLSLVVFGTLVGVTLMALTHILGIILQWTTPWVDRMMEQWHIFVVASARSLAQWVGGSAGHHSANPTSAGAALVSKSM